MPSFAESSNIDRSKLVPAKAAAQGPSSIPPEATSQMSAFMHCSMPLIASTYDSLTRQYYRDGKTPQTRILPVKEAR